MVGLWAWDVRATRSAMSLHPDLAGKRTRELQRLLKRRGVKQADVAGLIERKQLLQRVRAVLQEERKSHAGLSGIWLWLRTTYEKNVRTEHAILAGYLTILASIPLLLLCACGERGRRDRNMQNNPAPGLAQHPNLIHDEEAEERAAIMRVLTAPNPLDPLSMTGPGYVSPLQPQEAARSATAAAAAQSDRARELAMVLEDVAESASPELGSRECGICLGPLVDYCADMDRESDLNFTAVNDGVSDRHAGCVKLPCGHLFHRKCVTHWLVERDGRTCPCCRSQVLKSTKCVHSDSSGSAANAIDRARADVMASLENDADESSLHTSDLP
eukprot:g2222.t1